MIKKLFFLNKNINVLFPFKNKITHSFLKINIRTYQSRQNYMIFFNNYYILFLSKNSLIKMFFFTI